MNPLLNLTTGRSAIEIRGKTVRVVSNNALVAVTYPTGLGSTVERLAREAGLTFRYQEAGDVKTRFYRR